jgi:hypothetical protein
MELKDQLKQLGERFVTLKDQINTEEATKNAFIMPFLQLLGYEVFNPLEVVPEYITDVGTKKGEKIDYAIMKDGSPIILIECKHWNQKLEIHDDQLLRYFHVSKAKFAILTNGIQFKFYTDLVKPNIMDDKPFFEFNLTDIKDTQIEELKKFHKTKFDVETILNNASDLKYLNEIKSLFSNEVNNPSPEFVKHFAKQVYPSVVTAKVLEQFTGLTKRAINQHITDAITERLKSALTKETEAQKEIQAEVDEALADSKSSIVTTEEELEAFMIVKSILRKDCAVDRIHFRDAQSYFSLMLDDNNRKIFCRFYFNGIKKYITTIDNKTETRFDIETIDDIYKFADEITSSAKQHI